MKKIILFLAILFASSITCSAQLLSGVVNDPDGYTNIRTKPTTSAPVLFRYDSGDLIFYSPMKNGWSKVYEQDDVSTFLGYMSTSRIKRINISEMSDPPTESRPTYRRGVIVDPVDSYVNIRKGPGTNYPVYYGGTGTNGKLQLNKGDVVRNCGKKKNGFCLVSAALEWGGDEREGWVSAQYLRPVTICKTCFGTGDENVGPVDINLVTCRKCKGKGYVK